jgi:purine-binding chemotaxis protein CheW
VAAVTLLPAGGPALPEVTGGVAVDTRPALPRPVTGGDPAARLDGQVLVCRIGTGMCALPVRHVVEIMRPLPIERLSGVAPFVLGVSVIRGLPVPVVDAGQLVHGERQAVSRFVTMRVDTSERVVALAVTEVLGLSPLPDTALTGLPPLLGGPRRQEIVAMGVVDAGTLLVLDCARTVPESVWAALSAISAGSRAGTGR